MTLGDVHRGDDPTIGTLAFLREPLEGVGRVQDFEPGLGERLALLLGQGAGDLVDSLAHQVGRPLEDLGTIVSRQGTPGRKRTLRRGDGPISLGPRSIGHFGQDRLIGRIDHPQRLAVQGITPRSIDKHAGRILCRSCRASGRCRCHVRLSASDDLIVPRSTRLDTTATPSFKHESFGISTDRLRTGSPSPRYRPGLNRSKDLAPEKGTERTTTYQNKARSASLRNLWS